MMYAFLSVGYLHQLLTTISQIPFEPSWDYETMVLGTRIFLDAISDHVPSVKTGAFPPASVVGEYIYARRYKRLIERGDIAQSVDKVSCAMRECNSRQCRMSIEL